MKRMGLIVFLFVAMSTSYAQTTAEWLQQKKTRIRYLMQQVAAFQMYIGDVKKGYRTVRDGLHVINDIKHGDFDLHHDYFNSLSSVSAGVKGYSKVGAFAKLQSQIIDLSKATRKLFSSPFLYASEQSYITATINSLLQKCSDDVDKIATVTTSGKMEMTEERRLEEVNSLYESAQDKYSFAVHLLQSTQLLLRSRSKDKENTANMYSIYGLK